MAEPQPADVDPPQPPRGQQAAESAALSNLSTTDISADDTSATSTSKNESDIAALNNAISNLTVNNNATSSGPAKTTETAKAPPAKKVKIDANDVTWMVAELEVSKSAATAMLRAADGKREKAVEKFILPQPVNVASQA